MKDVLYWLIRNNKHIEGKLVVPCSRLGSLASWRDIIQGTYVTRGKA